MPIQKLLSNWSTWLLCDQPIVLKAKGKTQRNSIRIVSDIGILAHVRPCFHLFDVWEGEHGRDQIPEKIGIPLFGNPEGSYSRPYNIVDISPLTLPFCR